MSPKWILILIIGLFFIGIVSAEGPTGTRPEVIEIKPAVTAIPVQIEEGTPFEVEELEVTYTDLGNIVNTIIENIKKIITPDEKGTMEKNDPSVRKPL